MKLKGMVFAFWCCLAVGFCAADTSKPVKLADLPATVQKAIEKQAEGGKLGEIQRVVDEFEEVTYEVELQRDGTDRDFTLDVDGLLLSEQITLTEAPEAVQKVIKSKTVKATLDGIDKNYDDEGTYDVQITTAQGAERTFTVDEKGKITSEQVGFEDLPVAVRATVKQQAGTAKLGDIFHELDEDGSYYDVTVSENGKEHGFTVADSGRLESVQVTLTETPPPVHKTIKQHIGNGKIISIDKVFDTKGGFNFSITGRKNGEEFDFSVGPKGGFLGRDN